MTSADLKEGLMFYSETSERVGVITQRTETHATIYWKPSEEKRSFADIVRFPENPYRLDFLLKRFKDGTLRELTPLEAELWS
jgi:hypothetical protein